MPVITLVLTGWAGVALLMFILWVVQRRTGDAGIVDVGWSAALGLLAILYAFGSAGDVERRVFVALLACFWSFRLAYYLLRDRVLSGDEDGRYRAIRERMGDRLQPFLFWFFQAQGLLDVLLSLPMLVAMNVEGRSLSWPEWLAAALLIASVCGESLADRQLAKFRRDPSNRGKVCKEGLWRYSRHPNYFFEWLHWWTYVILAVGSPYWWLTLLAPAMMLFLILKVTGIPPTEAQALKSRGDAYRAYQRTTSALIPWFPREGDLDE